MAELWKGPGQSLQACRPGGRSLWGEAGCPILFSWVNSFPLTYALKTGGSDAKAEVSRGMREVSAGLSGCQDGAPNLKQHQQTLNNGIAVVD